MLEQICAFIHNFFYYSRWSGVFTIEDGTIDLPKLMRGQYVRILGRRFNDGVYQYPPSDLTDESFDGVIWEMRPPRAFLQLVAEIEAWAEKYGAAVSGPYQSESFGGYSYTLKSGNTNSGTDSAAGSWQGVFRARLNEWRKIS